MLCTCQCGGMVDASDSKSLIERCGGSSPLTGTMNKQDLLSKVDLLIKFWQENKIPKLHTHEVHPNLPLGSRERYLYFTLAPALNFQRQSPALWRAALSTWEDPKTNYLFFPEQVIQADRLKIQKDLRKHKLSLQQNKHTDIWIKLCESLNQNWSNDPRGLLINKQCDVSLIINYLQANKKSYPYLNGSKMANYWLYILDQYTDIKLKDKDKLSIIPDTHVQQCSVCLGLTKEGDSPERVADAWFELLKDVGIAPVTLHPILWNWSRNNFEPEV